MRWERWLGLGVMVAAGWVIVPRAHATSDAGPPSGACWNGPAEWITCSEHADCRDEQTCNAEGYCQCGDCSWGETCEGDSCQCLAEPPPPPPVSVDAGPPPPFDPCAPIDGGLPGIPSTCDAGSEPKTGSGGGCSVADTQGHAFALLLGVLALLRRRQACSNGLGGRRA
ncbi:MAG: MYXO-CTERM sorting domain-containing protein [Polyangiales bacterium]|nr:hypothetical protein [Myxococcales bacterium]